jgi:HTH-type transcriptional regulator, competence development regulator
MKFGRIRRELRTQSGKGFKRLAPELGVSYSYLSKLENEEIGPSEELIERIAEHFGYDRAKLMLSAGKVPEEIVQILQSHPDEAIRMLRERFADRAKQSIS